MLCWTRRAPYVRSLPSTASSGFFHYAACPATRRNRYARHRAPRTSSPPARHHRCIAMKPTLTSTPTRSRLPLFSAGRAPFCAWRFLCAIAPALPCRTSSRPSQEMHAADQPPLPVPICAGRSPEHQGPRAACISATPRSLTILTASSLNSLLNFLLVTFCYFQFHFLP